MNWQSHHRYNIIAVTALIIVGVVVEHREFPALWAITIIVLGVGLIAYLVATTIKDED